MSERELIPVNIAIMTVSDSRTGDTDTSGAALVKRLIDAGHTLAEKIIVPDDVYKIRAVVSRLIADPDVCVIISTGGTSVGNHITSNSAYSNINLGILDAGCSTIPFVHTGVVAARHSVTPCW